LKMWDRLGLNQHPFDYESTALPLSYNPEKVATHATRRLAIADFLL
jgi:hypothetical protein